MNFRKDINGLRAIAVIAVVLYHFNPSWLPGGFAGVDVFFVISGYLMTGIIFRGFNSGDFSILNFYVARANRIIPPLFILCLILFIFGWFNFIPTDYRELGKHAASSIVFLSNLIYLNETDYFATSSSGKWLLHTWSLSVEWQFYMLYPVILVALKRFMSLNSLKIVIVFCAGLGFVYCIYATALFPSESYYSLQTRAWEMMVGGAAFLYPLSLIKKDKWKTELVGLSLILGTYFFVSKDNLWPGYLSLIPVLGAYLVIQSNRDYSIITGNAVFQKIGSSSYSIYLWHWPLAVAIYYYSPSEIWNYIAIIASFILGWISYKYIEKIRFRMSYISFFDLYKCKPIYMVMILFAMGTSIYVFNGFNDNFRYMASTPKAKFIEKYQTLHKNLDDAYWLKCDMYNSLNKHNTFSIDKSCTNQKGNSGIFLWGDSHAEALSLGIRSVFKGIPFYQVTSASCKASLNEDVFTKGDIKKACDASNKLALKNIEKLKPRVVLIAQANRHEKTNWFDVYNKLIYLGVKKVVLIGPVSQWRPSLPRVITKKSHWNSTEKYITDDGLDLSILLTDQIMNEEAIPNNMIYISLIQGLCIDDNSMKSCTVRVSDGDLLQVDYGHLTPKGSLYVARNILFGKLKNVVFNE